VSRIKKGRKGHPVNHTHVRLAGLIERLRENYGYGRDKAALHAAAIVREHWERDEKYLEEQGKPLAEDERRKLWAGADTDNREEALFVRFVSIHRRWKHMVSRKTAVPAPQGGDANT
jgi:hypothetical protein